MRRKGVVFSKMFVLRSMGNELVPSPLLWGTYLCIKIFLVCRYSNGSLVRTYDFVLRPFYLQTLFLKAREIL